jgi:hypothetical protein
MAECPDRRPNPSTEVRQFDRPTAAPSRTRRDRRGARGGTAGHRSIWRLVHDAVHAVFHVPVDCHEAYPVGAESSVRRRAGRGWHDRRMPASVVYWMFLAARGAAGFASPIGRGQGGGDPRFCVTSWRCFVVRSPGRVARSPIGVCSARLLGCCLAIDGLAGPSIRARLHRACQPQGVRRVRHREIRPALGHAAGPQHRRSVHR